MNSKEYYDDFITYQIKSGINDRIYSLYKRLFNYKLNSNFNILEFGCGIGCLTFLLSKKITKGTIESIDISPKSIEYAKKNILKKNIIFRTANILDYIPIRKNYDRILLFDVLEHIPIQFHKQLFNKISNIMDENSMLLINIPNPYYIIYDQINNPQVLQEIDQPIFLNKLINTLFESGLDIYSIDTYGVWVKDEYKFLVIKKNTDFSLVKLNLDYSILNKMLIRLNKIVKKLLINYPIKK